MGTLYILLFAAWENKHNKRKSNPHNEKKISFICMYLIFQKSTEEEKIFSPLSPINNSFILIQKGRKEEAN